MPGRDRMWGPSRPACPLRNLTLSVDLPPGSYLAQTFDPRAGTVAALPVLESEGTARLEIPPFSEDVAVLLHQTS